ncbi:MAG: tRNA preQ1(34) S-adenosylmethionine ribosyltransferase-isomerase QueA [Desulfovibrio sp.]|jgi:S-adenosylmethionine:tRNA ribosyltransferase-isomerase|nr:tRNA preQ1(34) S-adenosylmethionine ribosyltransferase-isomerase QueA [Desulfovibrio sp.]
MHPDHCLASYTYELPEDRIAQTPAAQRQDSKLMSVRRQDGGTRIHGFADLPSLLPEGTLLVANNSKVIPARLYGSKPTGGRVEFLLLTPLPLLEPVQDADGLHMAEAWGLLRASKAPKAGQIVNLGPDFFLRVLERAEFGRSRVALFWRGDLQRLMEKQGRMPLPPYIRREAQTEDKSRYQTIYAKDDKAGSVAAPTAGLHFTPEVRSALKQRGCQWAEVTLYVGYGTFSPVREPDIRNHVMHEEYIEVPRETAAAVQRAKDEGRPVLAVGTTSARTLEGMHRALGRIGPYKGMTDIFIRPGYTFRVVDNLLTNFHLPESSLLIMVSALVGREAILNAYSQALRNDFRFFSYGDAMLIS